MASSVILVIDRKLLECFVVEGGFIAGFFIYLYCFIESSYSINEYVNLELLTLYSYPSNHYYYFRQ